MTAVELLAKCHANNIVLQAHGDQLDVDAPRGNLTPDLLGRLREHKVELLRLLATPEAPRPPAASGLEAMFPRDLMKALRCATVRLEPTAAAQDAQQARGDAVDVQGAQHLTAPEHPQDAAPDGPSEGVVFGPDGWPVDTIDPSEVPPCPTCGSLEQWLSAAGDMFGLTPGRWRCLRCDPPAKARRLAERVERIRQRRSVTRECEPPAKQAQPKGPTKAS